MDCLTMSNPDGTAASRAFEASSRPPLSAIFPCEVCCILTPLLPLSQLKRIDR